MKQYVVYVPPLLVHLVFAQFIANGVENFEVADDRGGTGHWTFLVDVDAPHGDDRKPMTMLGLTRILGRKLVDGVQKEGRVQIELYWPK